jgi:isochorismate hydrolase
MSAKEKYFSPESIDNKALELLEKVKNIAGVLKKQEFAPQKSALIVIDMQKYFCDESSIPFVPSVPAIIPKIKRLTEEYAAKNLPVIFTRQVNTFQDAGMMSKWWRHTISRESALSEITPEFAISQAVILSEQSERKDLNTFILDKPQYDAFYNTGLEDFLREKGVSQLVITGLLTHLCCETTARSAFVRGFETFVCVDGMVTYKEIYHTSSLINLAHGVSSLVVAEEICRKLNNES